MKKILLYTDTPQVGGAELQIFLLAKFLDKNNFQPILACSNYPQLDRWCEKFAAEGIPVYRLNVKHKHDPRHRSQLKKIIKAEKIDILHVHIWNPASCRYALSLSNIPIVVTEHDPFKLGFFKTLIKNHLLKNVSKIVAVSKENAQNIKRLYPYFSSKVAVIHNGIDITWWQSQLLRFTDEDRKNIKEDVFLAKENTLIVCVVAELHERKGQKYLIQAIPAIIGKFPNVKFVFIGDGPDRENLEQLCEKLDLEKHTIFLGKQKEIPKLLKASDIFCLPSRREAFGFVNLEAMITGLPVVASAVGGIPEIIENEKNGLLVTPENSAALAQALIKLIGSEKLREKFITAGEKRVHENFDAKIMAKEYEKIYSKV